MPNITVRPSQPPPPLPRVGDRVRILKRAGDGVGDESPDLYGEVLSSRLYKDGGETQFVFRVRLVTNSEDWAMTNVCMHMTKDEIEVIQQ